MKKKRRSWKTVPWEPIECDNKTCWCGGAKAETGTIVISCGDMRKTLVNFLIKEHNELLRRRKNDD